MVLVPVFIAWIRISWNAESADHFLILRRRPKLALKDCSFQEYLGLSKLQSLVVTACQSFMCSPESASWKKSDSMLVSCWDLFYCVLICRDCFRKCNPLSAVGSKSKSLKAGLLAGADALTADPPNCLNSSIFWPQKWSIMHPILTNVESKESTKLFQLLRFLSVLGCRVVPRFLPLPATPVQYDWQWIDSCNKFNVSECKYKRRT